jgi:hypothetical protein
MLFCSLTYAHGLSFLVHFAVSRAINLMCTSHGSWSTTCPKFPVRTLSSIILVLLHQIVHGLLTDPIVAKIVELFQFVGEDTLIHSLVDLGNQISERLLNI